MNNIIDYRIKKAYQIFYQSKSKCIFNRPLIKNIIDNTNLFKYEYDVKNLGKIIKDIFDAKEIKLKSLDIKNKSLNYTRKSNYNESKFSNIRIIFYNNKHDVLNINSSINYSNIVQFLLISNNISYIKIPLINIDCTRDQVPFIKNSKEFKDFDGKYLTIQVSENYNKFKSLSSIINKLNKEDLIYIYFFYCHFLFDVSKKYPNIIFNHKIHELDICKLNKKSKKKIFINNINFELNTNLLLKVSSFRYTNINNNFKNSDVKDNLDNLFNINQIFKKFIDLPLKNNKLDIADYIINCKLFKNFKKDLDITKNSEKIKKNQNILSKHKYMENNDTSDISSFDLSTEQIETKNTLDNNSESSEISDIDLSDSNEYTKSALEIDHDKTMTKDSTESFSLSSNKSNDSVFVSSSDSNNSVFVKNSDFKVVNKKKSIFRRKLHSGLTNMSSSVSSRKKRSKRSSSMKNSSVSSSRTKNSFVSKESLKNNSSKIRNALGAPTQNPYQMRQPQMSNGLPQHLQGVNPLSIHSNSQNMVVSEASQNQAINSISANMLSPQIPQQNTSLANSNIPQYLHSQIANRLPANAQNVIPQNFSGQLPPHMVNQLNLQQQPQMIPQQPQMMTQANQQQILSSLPQGYSGPLPGGMYGGGKKKE